MEHRPFTCDNKAWLRNHFFHRRNSKSKSEFYDPCQEAAQRSYRCLFRNGGDKTMCGEYFQCVSNGPSEGDSANYGIGEADSRGAHARAYRAYRDCKQAWVSWAYQSNQKRSCGLMLIVSITGRTPTERDLFLEVGSFEYDTHG